MKAALSFIILLALCPWQARADESQIRSTEISHYGFGAAGSLRLAFPARVSGKLYLQPLFGLKIESVIMDGMVLDGDVRWERPDERAYVSALVEHPYIYIVSGETLTAVDELHEEGVKVKTFNVDVAAQEIVIKYRIRFPDGKLGQIQKLVSRRLDSRRARQQGQSTSR